MADIDLLGLFSNSREIGFITDRRGAILAVTRGAEKALGYGRLELVGLDLPHLAVGDEFKAFFSDGAESRLRAGFQLRTKSGRVLSVDAVASCLRDGDGDPVGWFFAGQDLRGSVAEARGSGTILDALVDSTGAALWSFDRNGTVITWSRACQGHLGYSRAEAEGKLSALRLFSCPEEFRRLVRQVDETGQFSGEVPLHPREGPARIHQLSASRLASAEGLPLGITVVSFDVSERRKAEEFFRVLFEKANSGILMVEADSLRVAAANERAAELLGVARERLAGAELLSLHPEFDREAARNALEETRTRGEGVLRQLWLVRGDGTAFPVEASARRIVLGERTYVVTLFQDITERLRTARELEEAKVFLEKLRDEASDAIFLLDERGAFRYVNERGIRMVGRSREELVGATLVLLTPPDRLPLHRELFEKVLGGERIQIRTEMLLRDGTRVPVEVAAAALSMGGKRFVTAIVRDITEQVRAEREIEEAAAFLQHIQENASDGFALIDDQGRYVSVNRRLCEIGGRSREELLGRSFEELAPPEYLEGYRQLFQKLLAGETVEMRTRVVTPHGEERFVDVRSSPVRRGGRTYVFAIVREATGQVRAHEQLQRARAELERGVEERAAELRESEERFRSAFDSAAIGMCLVAPDGRFLQANRLLCSMLGYEEKDLLGRDLQSVTHPEDLPRCLPLTARAVAGEMSAFEIEERFLHRDGREVWGFLTASLLRDPQGVPLYFIIEVQDVTERRRAQETLRESEERFRAMMDAALDAVIGMDAGGAITYWNRRAEEMFGWTAGEAVGRSLAETIVPEAQREAHRRGLERFLATGQGSVLNRRVELAARRRDGIEIPVELAITPLRTGESWSFMASVSDVTERRKAEEALRESEERFRGAFEHAGIGMCVVGPDGRFLKVNASLCGMLGYGEGELLGRTFNDVTLPEDREKSLLLAREMLSGKRAHAALEKRYVGKDGRHIWGYLTTTLVRDGAGKPLYFVSGIQDVTERRQAHEDLERRVQERTAALTDEIAERRRAEEDLRLYQEIFAHASDAIIMVSPQGKLIAQNEAHRRLIGYSDEEVVGKSPTLWSPHDFERGLEEVRKSGSFRGEVRNVTRSGEEKLVELSSFAVRNAAGGILCFVAIKREVTERKRSEEQIRFQKTLLESQSEAAIDGILVVSAEGKMISFNRRFVEMWRIPPEIAESRSDDAALGSVLDNLVDPEGFLSRVRYLYDHPDEVSRDEIALKDGRTFDRYSGPVRSLDGVHYGRVWYFRDVTGRKRTEQELRRAAEETRKAYDDLKQAQAQLIRSEKLASIGMLVSGVAHEINNPLNVMYGNLQLLAEACARISPMAMEGAKVLKIKGIPGRMRRFRGMIRDALKAAEHARRIVEEFRSFARDTRTAEPVDLNVCLEETVSLLQRELEPRIRLVRRLKPLPPVRCFRGQMNQVFLNLLKNALEAIDRRGTITLSTRRKANQVIVEVSDTGRGMPEEVRRKLFEPFFTTKPVGKGMGLGLSISAMIVQNHGGTISAASRSGHGSVFTVELPIKA